MGVEVCEGLVAFATEAFATLHRVDERVVAGTFATLLREWGELHPRTPYKYDLVFVMSPSEIAGFKAVLNERMTTYGDSEPIPDPLTPFGVEIVETPRMPDRYVILTLRENLRAVDPETSVLVMSLRPRG